jgi:hypothetical protein
LIGCHGGCSGFVENISRGDPMKSLITPLASRLGQLDLRALNGADLFFEDVTELTGVHCTL